MVVHCMMGLLLNAHAQERFTMFQVPVLFHQAYAICIKNTCELKKLEIDIIDMLHDFQSFD